MGPSHPKTMSEMTKPLCKEKKCLNLPEWLIVAIKEYLFVKETSSSTGMGTTRCLFDSL